MYEQIEKEWQESQFIPNMRELLGIFPQARKMLEEKVKDKKRQISELWKLEHMMGNTLSDAGYEDRWFWEMVIDKLFAKEQREELQVSLKRDKALLNITKRRGKTHYEDAITHKDIAMAKEVPVDTFVQFNKSGFALCHLHTEEHASLKWYKRTNTWYCFGACGGGGDVIDFVMGLQGLTFIEAIKILIKK